MSKRKRARAKHDRIDEPARREEKKSARARMRLSARTGWRLLLAQSLLRGEPNREKIALTVLADKVRELI